MAETIITPCPVPEPSHRPGSEIGYARPGSNDRGFKRVGQAINSLLALRRGMLVCDVMDPAEMPLTPSDPLVTAGVHRRWMVKTPSYLNQTAVDTRQITVVIRYAKGAGAGLQYTLSIDGGASTATFNAPSGAVSETYATITSSARLTDTKDYQEILLEQTGWHGGTASTDYVRGVFVFVTDGWTTMTDLNEGWRNELIPVQADLANADGSAATWLVQSAQDLLTYIYERSVPTMYTGTGECDLSGTSDFTKYGRVRLEPVDDVEDVRFWAYCTGYSSSSQFIVSGNTAAQASVKPGVTTKWVSIDFDVTPGGKPIVDWGGEDVTIWSVCVYCQDAVYGG